MHSIPKTVRLLVVLAAAAISTINGVAIRDDIIQDGYRMDSFVPARSEEILQIVEDVIMTTQIPPPLNDQAVEVTTVVFDDVDDEALAQLSETATTDAISNDEASEGITVTSTPLQEAYNVPELSDSAFASFGSASYRPIFPTEDAMFEPENVTELAADTRSPVYTPGVVDVHLAQLADIRVDASNDSVVNVFVANDGLNCSCGILPSHRIVNGEAVKINQLPWTVALFRRSWLGFFSSKPYCGGTLINSKYIVTASHCVDGMSAGSLKARLFEEDLIQLNENEMGYQEVNVEKIIMHPKYDRRHIDNDIALLQLAQPVNMSGLIVPACLPAEDRDLDSQLATVAGWGSVSEGGSQSQKLLKVDVPIISNFDCSTKTVYKMKITPNMLCAGYIDEGKKDACQGDSGGPLVIQNGERKTLVGVVSWGYGCARPKSPGVYARVGRYSSWILENTKDGQWCSS